MQFTLFDFQEGAAASVVRRLRQGRENYAADGDLTAIGLTAPTGTGKTVMATAVLERLMFGHGDEEPNRDLTVIWFSDDKHLNKQTEDKLIVSSSRITANKVVALADVDQRVLDPGLIYMAHMQQFGVGATSSHAVNKGVVNDHRTFGLWDMIGNTIRVRGKDVLLVIDEAHRGAVEATRARKTIISTIVHGGKSGVGVSVPPAPIVFGLSATPQKFTESMAGAGRTLTPVSVDMEKVIESGIIKDEINVPRPTEKQKADHTLLADSVAKLRTTTDLWRAYHDATGDTLVVPIMVVQVPPAVSKTAMKTYVDTVQKAWPEVFQDKTIAHSFDTHVEEKHGEVTLRYIPPSDIAEDDVVRVVFFKNALTTGWDCPRAEVMVSLRSSTEPTPIAQLIGRMVRTPLAKRIYEGDPSLNSVFLHLPLYDRKQVAQVVSSLTQDPDIEGGPSLTIGKVNCLPIKNAEKYFDALTALPSHMRPDKTYRTPMAAASALAGLIADHDFAARPTQTLTRRIVAAISRKHKEHSDEIDEATHDLLYLDMTDDTLKSTEKGYVISDAEGGSHSLRVRDIDVRSSFRKAKTALDELFAQAYVNHLINEGVEPLEADATTIALAAHNDVVVAVEKAARDQIAEWRSKHGVSVDRLGPAERSKFVATWSPGLNLIPTRIMLPDNVSVPTARVVGTGDDRTLEDITTRDKHLYVDPDSGLFPVDTSKSGWERDVLDVELARPGTEYWYRNPSRGMHALAIPYDDGDGRGLMHPDFLFLREQDGKVIVDIIDPHMHSNADTGPKWRGLAAWAAVNPDLLGVVEAVIKIDDQLRGINLRDPDVVTALEGVSTKDAVEAVFATHGRNLA